MRTFWSLWQSGNASSRCFDDVGQAEVFVPVCKDAPMFYSYVTRLTVVGTRIQGQEKENRKALCIQVTDLL